MRLPSVLLLVPALAAAQLPPELARERREYAAWLVAAPNSPHAALAQQPVGSGLTLGPDDADIPVAGLARHRLTANATTATLEGPSGRRVLARGRVVPLGGYRLAIGGAPGRLVATLFGRAHGPPQPPTYYDYDASLVVGGALAPPAEPATLRILTVDGVEVEAVDAGTLTVPLGGAPASLRVMRVPGTEPDESELEIYFRDATSGAGSYPAGRFVTLEPAGEGRWRLDFNRARNPFCAYNSVYPCPAPWRGNTLAAPVRAGERYATSAAAPEVTK
jgi:hypothetical protein